MRSLGVSSAALEPDPVLDVLLIALDELGKQVPGALAVALPKRLNCLVKEGVSGLCHVPESS